MFNYLIALIAFAPAGIANMIPVLVAKWRWFEFLNEPIDAGLMWREKRVLGDHKTWRGLLVGSVVSGFLGVLAAFIWVKYSGEFGTTSWELYIHIFERYAYDAFVYAFLLGLFALLGDMAKSFFKRQMCVPAGKSWFPWDQCDYILGGFVVWLFYGEITWDIYVVVFIIYFGLHLLVSYVGYLLGYKNDPI